MNRKFEDTGSHISTMVKDIGISTALAREKGLPLFATSAAQGLFQAGISRYPEGDNWAIVKLLEEFSGTESPMVMDAVGAKPASPANEAE